MAAVNPNSSFASKRLTRGNYSGPSLLSRVGGRPNRTVNVTKTSSNQDSDSSDDPLSTQETVKPRKPEPATDDDPLSSTDDNGSLGYDRRSLTPMREPLRRTTWSSRDLEYNRAQVDADAKAESTPKKRRRANTTAGPRQSPKRTRKKRPTQQETPKAKESEDTPKAGKGKGLEQVWFTRPTNPVVYGSAKKPGLRNAKAARTKPLPRPKFKHSQQSKETAAGDPAVHSSQASNAAPQFKFPISYPGASTPSSSMPTASSHENESYPADLFDNDHDAPLSPLSSVSSTISLSLSPEDKRRLSSAKPPAIFRCPVCEASVDADFFKSFNLSRGASVRKEAKFCRAHRARTAEQEWTKRGYPEIDWDGLQKRIETHFAEIESILTMKKESFFRNVLEATANNGKKSKKNNLRLTATSEGLDGISSGYYGSRGAKSMYGHLFSSITAHYDVWTNQG